MSTSPNTGEFSHTPLTLLCAVGASLFSSNLSSLTSESQTDDIRTALAQGYAEQDWLGVAAQLRRLPPTERLCGAEISSVADLLTHAYTAEERLHSGFV